ncbi:MAG: tRNA pseudouridine(54/55) synthase Pus10, partial [Candidatus Thermoplasmatota archaeon]
MEERVLCKECIKFIDKPLNFEQSQKDGCWLCNGIFEEINSLAELVIKKLSSYEYSTFLIGSKFDNDILGRAKELGIDIKGKFNEKIGLVVSKALKKNPDFKKPDIMAIVDTNYNVVNLQIRSICIYGRYIKLVRGIPQTRYYKKCFEKIYETSVEEEIGKKILFYANGTNYKFHGMGREDIDARMLGNGRPFILEVINPKIRNIDLESIRSE